MKRIILLILFTNFFIFSFAQVRFQKTISGPNTDIANAVQKTFDNGFVIVGYTNSFSSGNNELYLIRMDEFGNLLWTKTIGGTTSVIGLSVIQTPDSGFVISGQIGGLTAGNSEECLIRTDAYGNIIWTKAYGGQFASKNTSVQATNDGGYILTGYTNNFAFGLYNIYIIKTDINGDTLWTKILGGTNDDYAYAIKQTSDNGFILTGYEGSVGSGNSDAFLIKTDVNGDTLWTKFYGGINGDFGYSVEETFDGGFIIGGITLSFGAGSLDAYLLKTDENGVLIWSKTYGGINDDMFFCAQQTSDSGFILAGRSNSFGSGDFDFYLVKTDMNGDTLWTRTFGSTNFDRCYYVQQTSDNGFVLVGASNSFGSGNYNIYFIKTDMYGNSGCNEFFTNTLVNSPTTLVTSFPLALAAGAVVSSPAFIEGSGGTITTNCFSVGISENSIDNSVLVYPSPSSGLFTVELPELIQKGKIEVYNLVGKEIYSDDVNQTSSISVNLNGVSCGIYFIVISDEHNRFVKKIVVE